MEQRVRWKVVKAAMAELSLRDWGQTQGTLRAGRHLGVDLERSRIEVQT